MRASIIRNIMDEVVLELIEFFEDNGASELQEIERRALRLFAQAELDRDSDDAELPLAAKHLHDEFCTALDTALSVFCDKRDVEPIEVMQHVRVVIRGGSSSGSWEAEAAKELIALCAEATDLAGWAMRMRARATASSDAYSCEVAAHK